MGFNLIEPNDDYAVQTMGQSNPFTNDSKLPEPGVFGGLPTALGHGVVGGLGDVANAVNATGVLGYAAESEALQNGLIDASEADQFRKDSQQVMTDQIKRVQEWAKINPNVTGTGSQIAGSAAHGLTVFGLGTLAGGPMVGAGFAGAVEGHQAYADAIEKGMDQTTALKMAGITGTMTAAGAFLPGAIGSGWSQGLLGLAMRAEMAGNTALSSAYFGAAKVAATAASNLGGKYATGAVGNLGFGMVNRALTSSVLENAGYSDMAKQYAVLDAQSMVADSVMGLLNTSMHVGNQKLAEWKAANAEKEAAARANEGGGQPAPDAAAAPEPLAAVARPPEQDIQTALDVKRNEQVERAVGIPTDPAIANLNVRLQDEALGNVIRGRPVNVSPEDARTMAHGALLDPEHTALSEDAHSAARDLYGEDLLDNSEPERIVPTAAEFAPATDGNARPYTDLTAHGLDDLASERVNQMASVNPDEMIVAPDGTEVRAADYAAHVEADMQSAAKDARLHDVAISCFLRTE